MSNPLIYGLLIFILYTIISYYADAVSTVQPVGTPLLPVVVQVAAAFFTNVPVAETPLTQFAV